MGTQGDVSQQPAWQHYRGARTGDQVVSRNKSSRHVFVLCNGWAYRFVQLANGRRQILNFILPGDPLSVVTMFEEPPHFSAQALTDVRLSGFDRTEVRRRFASSPGFTTAIARSWVAGANDSDELLTVLGQRAADERIAYLFLHLMRRISARNVVHDQHYRLPLRQQHIADAVGLTPVHVSRVIGQFRDRGLIEFSGGVLHVLDLAELERIGSLA
ncbi:MAG TPA: Crp/Fnr family transcriptional regulator [Afipia sp.]